MKKADIDGLIEQVRALYALRNYDAVAGVLMGALLNSPNESAILTISSDYTFNYEGGYPSKDRCFDIYIDDETILVIRDLLDDKYHLVGKV